MKMDEEEQKSMEKFEQEFILERNEKIEKKSKIKAY